MLWFYPVCFLFDLAVIAFLRVLYSASNFFPRFMRYAAT